LDVQDLTGDRSAKDNSHEKYEAGFRVKITMRERREIGKQNKEALKIDK